MAQLISYLSFAFVLGYVIWQVRQAVLFRRAIDPAPAGNPYDHTVSVVIPFRNEADHLAGLVKSLLSQDYPAERLHLIFVDDHSTDGSAGVIEHACAAAGAVIFGGAGAQPGSGDLTLPSVRLLRLADHRGDGKPTAHKKAALTYAIDSTDSDLIFTTDADCQLPRAWVSRMNASFAPDTQVVCGLVEISPVRNFCDYYQFLDLAAYQFLTAVSIERGTPTLANGAAFGFRRSAFIEAGGYRGVDHLPSGDDVLLLHKFTRVYSSAAFRFLAAGPAVVTAPVDGWMDLWRQRLRWAGKAGSYQSPYLQFAQFQTFFACAGLLLLFLLSWYLRSAALFLMPLAFKVLVDYANLRAVLRLYRMDFSGRHGAYLLTALIYPLFLVAVGLAVAAGQKTTWKGRAA